MGPKESICELLINYSIFYNPIPDDKVIEAYVNKLHEDGFTPSQVKYVLDETIKNNVFFPKICDFHKAFPQEESIEDKSVLYAATAVSCIGKYGYDPINRHYVLEEIGEEGLSIISTFFGGWKKFCEMSDTTPEGVMRPHLEKVARSYYQKRRVEKNILQVGFNRENDLKKLNFGDLNDFAVQ